MDNNIDELRKKAALTVQELADKAGISRGYLNELKIGKKRLNLEVMERLAKPLKCAPADIIKGSKTLPVSEYIGERGELFPLENPDQLSNPGNLPPDSTAAVVRGDFLLPFFQEGDMFIYSKSHKGAVPTVMNARQVNYGHDITNKPCIVGLKDGRVLFRKLRHSAVPGKYGIYGYNFREEEEVEIADAYKIIFAKFG